MKERARPLLVAALGMTLVGCFALDAPPGGISSYSPIILPSPSVVVGDTMRDSLGHSAPLRAFAFDQQGDTIAGVPTTFLVAGRGAHLTPDWLLVGDSVRDSLRVVANVGPLQTAPVFVPVSVPPDSVAPVSGRTADTIFVDRVTTDTLLTTPTGLSVRVAGRLPGAAEDTFPARGFVVLYDVVQAPPAQAGHAAVIVGPGTNPSSRDTTDHTGTAQRTVALNLRGVAPAWLDDALQKTSSRVAFRDSIVVQAIVRAPPYFTTRNTVRFVVLLRNQF